MTITISRVLLIHVNCRSLLRDWRRVCVWDVWKKLRNILFNFCWFTYYYGILPVILQNAPTIYVTKFKLIIIISKVTLPRNTYPSFYVRQFMFIRRFVRTGCPHVNCNRTGEVNSLSVKCIDNRHQTWRHFLKYILYGLLPRAPNRDRVSSFCIWVVQKPADFDSNYDASYLML